MASPTRSIADDENATHFPESPSSLHSTLALTRPVLGNVSPNVRTVSPIKANGKPVTTHSIKPLAGSPLKRSFTAAMDGLQGFTYLKKRKLSDDESLSESMNREQRRSSLDRPLFQSPSQREASPAEILEIPEIQHLSPTEPNTPSEDGHHTQGSSAERKSFSSLINYDPSSQTSHFLSKPVSNAELLRLRLRVALYKVRTNQINTPFAELCLEGEHRPRSTQDVVEEAVAALRREAQEVEARKISVGKDDPMRKLLPAPVLKPTAYSNRVLYEVPVSSPPPELASPGKLPTMSSMSTPLRAGRHVGLALEGHDRRATTYEQELTSSVVKGRVAEGLLGLRNAVA